MRSNYIVHYHAVFVPYMHIFGTQSYHLLLGSTL